MSLEEFRDQFEYLIEDEPPALDMGEPPPFDEEAEAGAYPEARARGR